jgi:serine/threonine protein kinase
MLDGDFQDETGEYQNVIQKLSLRHGNLKPENILNFQFGEAGLGRLKIADIELAKQDIVALKKLSFLDSARYGTATRYDAPEIATALFGRSGFCDIWSMGCITLEFIIWNLYGNDELLKFYEQVRGNAQHNCPYFEVPKATHKAEVHIVVRQWLDHILNTDPECSQDSAIRDLLKIVETRLLVVPLPPGRQTRLKPSQRLKPTNMRETIISYRATAQEFCEALDAIISKAVRPNYLVTGKDRTNARPPVAKIPNNLPSPLAAQRKVP